MAGLFSFAKSLRGHQDTHEHDPAQQQASSAAQFPGAQQHQQQYLPASRSAPPPVPPHPNDYAFLRARWSDILTGGENVNHSHPQVKSRVRAISNNAEHWLRRMRPTDAHVFPMWPLKPGDDSFRYTYARLKSIAFAYETPGTAQYHQPAVLDKILAGIDLVYKVVYNEDIVRHGRDNWYNIQIGAPKDLADICVLLYSQLGQERLRCFSRTMSKHAGDTNNKSLLGWNRVMVCQIHILSGLVVEDASEMRYGIAGLSHPQFGVFKYVYAGQGEGIYEDGSLISHEVYPYAGGYGLALLGAVVNLCHLLSSPLSPLHFQITDAGIHVFHKIVDRSFVPVVWQGVIMEHTGGRAVTRKTEDDWKKGHKLIGHLVVFAAGAPEEYSRRFKSLIKLWVATSPRAYVDSASLEILSLLLPILDDASIPVAEPPVGTLVTPLQDRVMHFSPAGWCFTTAAASTRTGRAEYLNGENEHCWFQGDGFSYLYLPNDPLHFHTNDYWPTLDPYHLPGVTNSLHEPKVKTYKVPALRDWSGGLGFLHNLGASSLDHFSSDRMSAAKKSWFYLDEGVICLGAGVNGKSANHIHTTIESRNLPSDSIDLNISIDSRLSSLDKSTIAAKHAHIPTVAGYLFLNDPPVPITFHREVRQGRWSDVNSQGDNAKNTELLTRTYQHIIHEHGVDPRGATYSYAILPLATAEDTARLSVEPVFRVLANNETVQAVEYDSKRGMVWFVTFWKAGCVERVTVRQPCMVVWNDEGIAVVDPSMKVNKVEIQVKGIGKVRQADDGVEIAGEKLVFSLKEGQAKRVEFEFTKEEKHGNEL